MNKFFNNKVKIDIDQDIDFQIIQWHATDERLYYIDDDVKCRYCEEYGVECECNMDEYVIRCFGRTDLGHSITCKIINFLPFYYIKVSDNFTQNKLTIFIEYIRNHYFMKKYPKALVKNKCCIVQKKDIYGFRNNKEYKYIKLVFDNHTALNKSKYIFKNPLIIPGINFNMVKFKLYESNFEGYLRFCHIKDILTAGWVRLPKNKYKYTNESNTQLEFEIDYKYIEKINKDTIANFLQASWDIEVYSYDRSFPKPEKIQNVVYQIATTYKYNNESDILVKHLLTLKKCDVIDDDKCIVEECLTEEELIKKWVNTINKMDPDIFYTYNGDAFDCKYLNERCDEKILNISDYFLKYTSRLKNIQSDMKNEKFQSGAYGDSEFDRLYIPGRLNYDLLIHYKRGMKKYSSYKLDFIANEILKQGKNDVTPKEIFEFYEKGDPVLIKKIGEYCIMDTELLQKLVDKQMILTNIIQLANVTYVPIEYLVTRGQTIKVYSQVLRKSMQTGFLVPHTNFNEDSYGIHIKMKDENNITIDDIGEYIQFDIKQINNKNRKISCKIINVEENNIYVNSNIEIEDIQYNKTVTIKRKTYIAKSISPINEMDDDSFTGACVLDAVQGLHRDNVAILDFASLYPTIQISRNLCFSTLVMDDKYKNIEGVKYENIEWDDKIEYKLKQKCEGIGKSGKSKGVVCGKQAFFEFEIDGVKRYYCRIHNPDKKNKTESMTHKNIKYSFTIVQPSKNENNEIINKGVIPLLLEELYSERKKVKKQMAQVENNKLLYDILDSTQLAIKISLNSVYGFLSRTQGNLICKPIGQMTTAIGRQLIMQSKKFAENEFLTFIKENELLTYKLIHNPIELNDEEKYKLLSRFID